jgi:hypothetical protein
MPLTVLYHSAPQAQKQVHCCLSLQLFKPKGGQNKPGRNLTSIRAFHLVFLEPAIKKLMAALNRDLSTAITVLIVATLSSTESDELVNFSRSSMLRFVPDLNLFCTIYL